MKTLQRFSAVCVALFFACTLSLSVFAADLPLVNDEAGILTSSEVAALQAKAEGISAEWGQDVVIVTVTTLDGYSAEAYADDYFDYNGFGQGSNYSGLVLLFSTEYRDAHISTCGESINTFTDYGIDKIFDAMTDDMVANNYYSAFNTFLDEADRYMEQDATGSAYDVNNTGDPIDYLYYIGIGMLTGLIAATGVCWFFWAQLRTKVPQREARAYVTNGGLRLTNERDLYLYSRTTRRARPKDNGGGGRGGSSTHRSSSGRSHGGGGRRF